MDRHELVQLETHSKRSGPVVLVDHQDNTHDRTHRAIAQLFCPNKYSLESVCMDGSVNAIQDRQNLQCWTLDTRKVQY